MYISQETPEQTETRLLEVISAADLKWREGAFAFYEYPLSSFPAHEAAASLAMVRDDQVWSVLKKADSSAAEPFALFSFHFKDNLDNSGFVGWLASKMKKELGTGVFVVCGQNSNNGGIFDYWGVPIVMREAAQNLVNRLRSKK
ncbi:MAG: hypothetical protein HY276_04220 [Ignavibacteriales bacterium]|nr:hypothetical protein [Ignavibacteriales bacterium]